MINLLRLIRVHHWVKNLFIFVPGFFAGVVFDNSNIITLLIGFFSFSLIASSIYIINDYKDIEVDKNHPTKQYRPLVSGEVSKIAGLMLSVVFSILGFAIAYFTNRSFFIVVCIYFLINIAYSFGLKRISILDILIIAFGFSLRTIAGGIILDVPLSSWLMIMIFLLALFLALSKRLDDLNVIEESGKVSRRNMQSYNLNFITSGITMISGIIIVSYIMYTISDEVTTRLNSSHLYFTSIFVIAGILRYLQIALVENNTGSPTKILYKDKYIIITLLGWILSFLVIIYL